MTIIDLVITICACLAILALGYFLPVHRQVDKKYPKELRESRRRRPF